SGSAGQQVELLEDEADVAAPPTVAGGTAELLERHLVEEQSARRRRVEQTEQVQQRRLARSRATHDRHVVADLDLEVDRAQDLEGREVRQLDAACHALEAEERHPVTPRR